mmetsp:Transcript_18996/g.44299  ORF Transcript_18996/g.44299 Transcript_18996/m.44299 type:complete len:430 (+) Transcript_18996:244-1533(+)|eukprot:CAMPEP_0178435804 /NCGR_PEP_ID=MMETSP0689_2-20121128/34117_1 /TAXON_ID=160604 /ORGANISM="Amphidinium massartii, Strain CS-259" /LENGTH=429 /DNA_ID=CAMNT_0020057889 /DNA_START=166 /DNA_END=1455 /DNA_ORIENTATION=+
MPEKADLDDDSFASPAEAELIEELRKTFADDLAALKAAGADFPHTTGDIFLTRVVRGMDRDLAAATQWFRKFLDVRKEHNFDEIHTKLVADGTLWKASAMPNAEKILATYNVHFDEEKLLSTSGHLIWYDSVGDIQSEELLKCVDEFKDFVRAMLEGRALVVDRLSREQGRLVKTIRIMDVQGLNPWTLNRELFKLFKGWAFPLVQQTSIEVVHRVFVINAAWFPAKLYALLRPIVPERIQGRVRLLGKDFQQNDELTQLISPALLKELMSTKKLENDDSDALEVKDQVIKAGQAMTKTVQATEGQTVRWEFKLGTPKDREASPAGSPSPRGMLGNLLDRGLGAATDVMFGVSLWYEKDQKTEGKEPSKGDEEPVGEQVLVAPHQVDAQTGLVKGEVTVPRAGDLVLTWSNRSSWVRAKFMAELKISPE